MRNEHIKEQIIRALEWIYPSIHRVTKDLNTEETEQLETAMLTLIKFLGTDEQYHNYKTYYAINK